MNFAISQPNLVEIYKTTTEISNFIDFQDGGLPPCAFYHQRIIVGILSLCKILLESAVISIIRKF